MAYIGGDKHVTPIHVLTGISSGYYEIAREGIIHHLQNT